MLRVIFCLVIPIGIGLAIDKLKNRTGPGWLIGFIVGMALYGAFCNPFGGD
jgi:hypothetical protein